MPSFIPALLIVILISIAVTLLIVARILKSKEEEKERQKRQSQLLEEIKNIFVIYGLSIEKNFQWQLRYLLEEIKNIIYTAHKREVPLRVNIMRPDRKGVLKIFAHIGMEGAPDLEMALSPGIGCAGRAFKSGRTTIGDLTQTSPKEWGLSDAQVEITKGLKSILSIPLKFKGKVIGVLNIDSSLPVESIGFNDPEMIKRIEIKSNGIADFLGFYSPKLTLLEKG